MEHWKAVDIELPKDGKECLVMTGDNIQHKAVFKEGKFIRRCDDDTYGELSWHTIVQDAKYWLPTD